MKSMPKLDRYSRFVEFSAEDQAWIVRWLIAAPE
jgi:hypothetical protein